MLINRESRIFFCEAFEQQRQRVRRFHPMLCLCHHFQMIFFLPQIDFFFPLGFSPLEMQLVALPSKVYSSRCSFGGHSFTGSSPVCLIRGPECKLTAPVEELVDFPSHLSWSSGPPYPPSAPPSPPSYASLIPTLGLCQQFLSLD